MSVRIKEHHKKYCDRDQNSSLFMHTKDNSHIINFQNIKILDFENNKGKRLFSEALFIHTQKNYINKQFQITRLPYIYNTLINNCEFLVSKEDNNLSSR